MDACINKGAEQHQKTKGTSDVFQTVFPNSGLQWGLAKSTLSLFLHSDRFDFVLGSHYGNRTFYVCFVLIIISAPRVKFVQ